MSAPCNAKPISLGLAPWNLYPARNVDTNVHIEVEHFNLVKRDGPVPLGLFALCSMHHALCACAMSFYALRSALGAIE